MRRCLQHDAANGSEQLVINCLLKSLRTSAQVPALLAMALLAQTAWAQYKVVQPDGSVLYTDRPPAVERTGKVTGFGPAKATGTASDALAGLPADLRSAAQRYPVTLFAGPECAACDAGRRLLQQRGIPYTERSVVSEEDAQALEKQTQGRSLPVLRIGPMPLRGFVQGDWNNYLDAAGYPKESRLPRTWKAAAASPLAARVEPPPRVEAPATPTLVPLPPAVAPQPGTVRF